MTQVLFAANSVFFLLVRIVCTLAATKTCKHLRTARPTHTIKITQSRGLWVVVRLHRFEQVVVAPHKVRLCCCLWQSSKDVDGGAIGASKAICSLRIRTLKTKRSSGRVQLLVSLSRTVRSTISFVSEAAAKGVPSYPLLSSVHSSCYLSSVLQHPAVLMSSLRAPRVLPNSLRRSVASATAYPR